MAPNQFFSGHPRHIGKGMPSTDHISLKNRLQDSLNLRLSQKGWTLRALSDRSGVPYETLKKLAGGKIDNPSLQSIVKVAQAFDCSLDALLMEEPALFAKMRALSARSRDFLEAIADFELALSVRAADSGQCFVPVTVPTGCMEDGMIYDSLSTEYMDISPYLSRFGSRIVCALKITGNAFRPVYVEGDILLIARDRQPHYGTVSVFLHHNQLYIRKYIPGTPPLLAPLNHDSPAVSLDRPEEWSLFGCVLTVARCQAG